MSHYFEFGFRLDCADYAFPHMATADVDSALRIAKSALVPIFNDTRAVPVDYDRDIAPRIGVTVTCLGYDDHEDPAYRCAEWKATVACGEDDFDLLVVLRQRAADEWNDSLADEYPIQHCSDFDGDA